jgi:competence protein ComEC
MWQGLPAWLVAWLLGTALQLQQERVWHMAWDWVIGAIAVTVLGLIYWLHIYQRPALLSAMRSLAGRLALGCVIALGACTLVNVRCGLQMQGAPDPKLEGQNLHAVVEVASLPHFGDTGVQFRGRVLHATLANSEVEVKVPHLIELNWSEWEAPTSMDLPLWQSVQAGDHWQFQLRLKTPHGSFNPGGFDEELRLWELGIMATGSVHAGKGQQVPHKLSSSWRYPVERWRQQVRTQIQSTLRTNGLSSTSSAGLIAALVMGDQAAIAQNDWQVFRATGVAHLMSISGLHITMLAWLASAVIAWSWRFSARRGCVLCLWCPAPFAASIGGVVVAFFYAIFCGWGLPAQRTVLMLCVMTVLRWQGLRWPWYGVWGLALWTVALVDPWALLQASFWLSFVAVGALILADPGAVDECTNLEYRDAEMVRVSRFAVFRLIMVTRPMAYLKSLAREQWVVTVALAPLSILFFGQLSLSGFLANLIAIPWVTLCVTPLALAGLLWHPMWQLAALAFQPLMALLTWLAQWPSGVWHFAQAPLGLTLLALLGALICFQKWPWAVRCWGLLLMLPVVLWEVPKPAWGQFDLWALDIGQGNAVVLRTANHALLYDSGPAWGTGADAGQRILVPFMSRMGIELDRLVLSHRDTDHTGGAPAVLAAHPHAELWTSLEVGHPLSQLREVHRCLAGQKWTWDGVRFEVLHPGQADYVQSRTSNGLSCVLRIDAIQNDLPQAAHDVRGASALLVGDIEAPQEQALLQAHAVHPVDFLLVPHHGSQTSSSLDFVRQLKPQWAMVQAGYRNRYGHPAPQVVARYVQLGVPLAMTPVCGAAHWQSQAPQALDCERDLRRRYWHYKAP